MTAYGRGMSGLPEVDLAGLPELVKLLESRRLDRHTDARACGPPTSNLGGRFEVDPMQALVMTLAVAATVAVAPGCTANAPPRTATPSSVAQGPSEPTAHGGCGNTQVHTGPMPTWANSGFSGSPTGLPWATGTPPTAIAIVYATELVALGQRPDGSSNKILWATETSTDQLRIVARPADGAGSPVAINNPTTNGNQVPSIVDLPAAGCWTFQLTWGAAQSSRSTLQLWVLPQHTLPPAA